MVSNSKRPSECPRPLSHSAEIKQPSAGDMKGPSVWSDELVWKFAISSYTALTSWILVHHFLGCSSGGVQCCPRALLPLHPQGFVVLYLIYLIIYLAQFDWTVDRHWKHKATCSKRFKNLGKVAVYINVRPSKIQETLGMLCTQTTRDVNVQGLMDFVEVVIVLTSFSSINLSNEAFLSTSWTELWNCSKTYIREADGQVKIAGVGVSAWWTILSVWLWLNLFFGLLCEEKVYRNLLPQRGCLQQHLQLTGAWHRDLQGAS